jgi:hypothetical protein
MLRCVRILSRARSAVPDAISTFDRLGYDASLGGYNFGRALSCFIKHDGKLYDSSAIANHAVGLALEQYRWTSDDLTVVKSPSPISSKIKSSSS